MASIIVVASVGAYVLGIGLLIFAFFCADAEDGAGKEEQEAASSSSSSVLSSARRWLSRLLLRRAPAAFLSLVRFVLGEKAAEALVSAAKYAFYERNPLLQVRLCSSLPVY